MPTLRDELDTHGIDTAPMPDVIIPTYDPHMLLQAQALFGEAILGNPDLVRLTNALGPVLFAMLLFTVCEDYQIDPLDEDNIVPTLSTVEAESKAIGIIRGVASAMGRLGDDLTSEPDEAEVEADTEISPV